MDLSGVDLSNAILDNAILVDVILVDANLSGASLINADLSRANLRGANLSGADLTNAILINADLSEADLTLANLENADTEGTKLSETKLTGSFVPKYKGDKSTQSSENESRAVGPPSTCTGGVTLGLGSGEDLEVTGECFVRCENPTTIPPKCTYHYNNVNIYNGGSLIFENEHIIGKIASI